MTTCSAPWYELNLSAPDSNVSACCYYSKTRDEWLDDPVDIGHYWNGPGMREVRRVQRDASPPPNGCSSCFFFEQRHAGGNYYDFAKMPDGMSAPQTENWLQAKADFEAKLEEAICTPLRIYANFGYTCNLSCTMCHQVPRRGVQNRQILADTMLAWHETLLRSLEVVCIGGEPFSLPEAIKFIRKFTPDERYEAVRLSIGTNGTVLHKHWKTLKQKRRLSLGVSLDSIGEGYDRIRAGGSWDVVERAVLTAMELKSSTHPEWLLSTNASLQKTALPYLPQFARWHVKHGVPTFFGDFISAPGVEDTYYTDNVLQNTQLLDDIPQWQDWLDEAIATFRSAQRTGEADSLQHYRDRVIANAERNADRVGLHRRQRNRNDWTALNNHKEERNWGAGLIPCGVEGSDIPTTEKHGLTGFAMTRPGDHFTTEFRDVRVPPGGGWFRLRAHWPKEVKPDAFVRLAHIVVQQEFFGELEGLREQRNFGFGTEVTIVGEVPNWVKRIRLVLTPQGEEVTLLPQTIEFDVDPAIVAVSDDGQQHSFLQQIGLLASRAARRVRRLGGKDA